MLGRQYLLLVWGNMPGNVLFGGLFRQRSIYLMGVGGSIHSLVDYNIAYFVAGTLSKYFDIPIFTKAKQLEKKRNHWQDS